MLRWHAKAICGVIMFVAMPVCFLLPVVLVDRFTRWGAKGKLFLDLLSCFAGGVFLSSYLVFMAPAVRMLIEEHLMKPNHINYPLPDMIIGLGFFIMLTLDKIVNLIINSTNKQSSMQPRNASTSGVRSRTTSASGTRSRNTSGQVMQSPSGIKLVENGLEKDSLDVADEDALSDVFEVIRRPHTSLSNGTGNGETLTRRQSIVDAVSIGPESMVRSVVMMMALSLDSVLEGMTIGLKKTMVEVWAIFIGIIVHESVIAFCLGLQLIRLHRRVGPVIMASVIYTLMNPIGVIIATSIYETVENDEMELANGILQALTSGCFIYIIFYEILEGQIGQNPPFSKIFAIFIGYIFLSAFAAIPGSGPYNFSMKESHGSQNGTIGFNPLNLTRYPY